MVREATSEFKGNVATREKYRHIIRSIGIMYVDGVSGITKICVERDDQNRRACTLRPALPKSFLSYSKQQLGNLIVFQKFRLLSLIQEQEVIQLEEEFSDFKRQTQLEEEYRNMNKNMDDYSSSSDARSSIGLNILVYVHFLGINNCISRCENS